MNNIFLIGFMGSGKSSVGQQLAHDLQMDFFDTDELIVKNAKKSIPTIFQDEGEEGFRLKETSVLSELKTEGAIIATGGGVVETQQNLQEMKEKGKIIYLHTTFNSISNRLENDDSRPLWGKDVIKREQLYKKRLSVYHSWATHVVETDGKSIDDICKEIHTLIKQSM